MPEQIMWAVKHPNAGIVVVAPTEESAWRRASKLYGATIQFLMNSAASGFRCIRVKVTEVGDA